jgi:hypothetical protein
MGPTWKSAIGSRSNSQYDGQADFPIQWTPLNGITLGQTVTDPINRMITISEHISYTKYAILRCLGLAQSGSV